MVFDSIYLLALFVIGTTIIALSARRAKKRHDSSLPDDGVVVLVSVAVVAVMTLVMIVYSLFGESDVYVATNDGLRYVTANEVFVGIGAKTYPNWSHQVVVKGDGWSVRAMFKPKPTVESLTVSREELKGEYRRSVAGLDPNGDLNGFVFAAYRTADKYGVRLEEHRLEHDLLRVKPRVYTSP